MSRLISMLHSCPMTLIVSLPHNDAVLSQAAFEAGADAVKVHCNLVHNASGNGFGSFTQYQETFRHMLETAKGPVGLVPGADMKDISRDMAKAMELPFDFFSLYAHHTPICLLRTKVPLMVAAGHGYAMEEASLFASLGIQALEASIIPADQYGQPVSARDLIAYKRLCQATQLPVVVPTQRKIDPEDLPSLAEAGIRGIMIGAVVTSTEQDDIVRSIQAFRNEIDRVF